MRIGLLESDHIPTSFQSVSGDYFDMFERLFGAHAPLLELVRYDVIGGFLPEDPSECDGYLGTGSRSSVYDDEPWIAGLEDFIRALAATRIPYVGICFGHQMLARALGGTVAKADVGWGAGVREVRLTEERPWMDPAESACNLQFMHQDQVKELPTGATLLGTADHCPVAMFSVGGTMLGIQAHPEFDVRFCQALIDARTDMFGAEAAAAARATMIIPTHEAVVAQWIERFLRGAVDAPAPPT